MDPLWDDHHIRNARSITYEQRANFYGVEVEDRNDSGFYEKLIGASTSKVLVIPCGYGSIIKLLVKQNVRSVLLDVSPRMVSNCRKLIRAAQATDYISVEEASILDLKAYNDFDLIIVPAESIQIFHPRKVKAIMRSLLKAVSPKGVIVLDTATFTPNLKHPDTPYYYDPFMKDETLVHEWTREWEGGSLSRAKIQKRDTKKVAFRFYYAINDSHPEIQYYYMDIDLWLHQPRYIRKICRDLSARTMAILGDYEGGPLLKLSPRALYVIERSLSK